MIDVLTDVIDALGEADPATLADPETIEAVHRQLARLEAVVTRATGAFDVSRVWAADGAQTAAAWLATRCSLPRATARRRVRISRSLRHLPEFEAAWLDGEVTGAHVATVAAVRRPETAAALARDEEMLVGHALSLRFEAFVRAVDYWNQLADPDGADDEEDDRTARRGVHLAESFAGMWFGKMTLDPVSGATVAGELRRIEREMFEADWADARRRLGREPTVSDITRTPAQRRADALVEMATRSRTAPADGRRPAPLFTVLVGYETMHGRVCELAGGTVLAPSALLPWLEEAYIERAVFGLDDRVEVSARARLFTGATRRGIELRDRYCTHDYCDTPADECEGDHIFPYAMGGPTTQDNGEMLCGFHNRHKERQRPPPPAADGGTGP